MYEHSLGGWGSMLFVWFSTTFLSAWSGVNFVATRNNEAYFTLIVHILSGIIVVPLIFDDYLVSAENAWNNHKDFHLLQH